MAFYNCLFVCFLPDWSPSLFRPLIDVPGTMASTTASQRAPCCTARVARRHTACSSPMVCRGLRSAARQRQQAAGERRALLRVSAAQVAPAQKTGGSGSSGTVTDDNSVYDVVVVGAGISGLTTAQVIYSSKKPP